MWQRWRVVTWGIVPSLPPATLSSRRGFASCRELRPDGSCWEKGEGAPPVRLGQGCAHLGTRPGGHRPGPARGGTGSWWGYPRSHPLPKIWGVPRHIWGSRNIWEGSQAHLGGVPDTTVGALTHPEGISGTSGKGLAQLGGSQAHLVAPSRVLRRAPAHLGAPRTSWRRLQHIWVFSFISGSALKHLGVSNSYGWISATSGDAWAHLEGALPHLGGSGGTHQP